jgi:hypothetical protein
MCKTTNKKLVANNTFVASLYDQLLRENDKNISDAYNDAIVWIAELQLQINKLNNGVSSGYLRTDTSPLKWKSKTVVPAVDAGDAWVRTGVSGDG